MLVSIRKALGLDSTDGAVFCVTRVVVSEREQETCCSPEPVCTRTTREIAPLIDTAYSIVLNFNVHNTPHTKQSFFREMLELPCSRMGAVGLGWDSNPHHYYNARQTTLLMYI